VPVYSYKGYNGKTGDSVKGKIEAESTRAARHRLKQNDGIIVASIKEEAAAVASSGQSKKLFDFSFSSPKVKTSDLSVMTRQFATLQSAHVPLDESLKALIQQVENETLSAILGKVKDGVSEGKSLGEAMAGYPGVFNKLYVNMVSAGEVSGNLGLVLERLADFQEYQTKLKSDLFSAMSYPALMILASCGIIGFLFVSVVPKLQKIFDSLKVKLPFFTKLTIGISEFLQNHWLLLIIGTMVGVWMFNRWRVSENGKKKFDRFLLNLPVFGPILIRVNVSRFTKTLSTLLSSGVPIIKALDITKNIIPNFVIADVVEKAKISVQEGESLGLTIERSGEFPPLVSHMIKTGEKTGDLEGMLGHVATAYDAEVERKIAAMIALIEPAMIIVMGGIVVVVVMAMMVPMLSVMSQVR
jgi:general secretion pathway protein F